jgi:hypothetical protein
MPPASSCNDPVITIMPNKKYQAHQAPEIRWLND